MRGESIAAKPSIPISLLVFPHRVFRNETRLTEGHSPNGLVGGRGGLRRYRILVLGGRFLFQEVR